MTAAVPVAAAGKRIGVSRISVLTDEVASTPSDAIDFALQYGLKWVELRNVPGERRSYAYLPEAELRAAAKELSAAGLRVSFLNTGMLKYGLPGTELARRRPETPEQRSKRLAYEQHEFDNRIETLKKSIRAAHILGVDKVRVFAFLRVAEPRPLFQRIADIIGEMAEIAGKEKIQLLLENEASCNVATSEETAEILKLLPARWVGVNWDPHNAFALNERPFPDGYEMLPKARIGNVQMKAKTLLKEWEPENLDWGAIFAALARDGYKGQVGLETHIFDGRLIQSAHLSMKEILRIVRPS